MRLLVPACCLLVAIAIAGCSSNPPSDPTSSGPPARPREVSATVTFDANGISSPVSFAIPAKTRSVTVVVEGETSQLYGLASFVMADGLDRVAIDLGTSYVAEMKRSYFDEQVGLARDPGMGDYAEEFTPTGGDTHPRRAGRTERTRQSLA